MNERLVPSLPENSKAAANKVSPTSSEKANSGGLQELVNNSAKVKQLSALQDMIDNSTQIKKAAERQSIIQTKEKPERPMETTPPAQLTMAHLHGREAERSQIAGYSEDDFTTVGFEIDLLRTPDKSPLEGISHVVVGKTAASYGLLNMNYLLETDAGNVLELVTPPYLIKRTENGVLDAADLKLTMADLKEGFTGTRDDIGGGQKNVTGAFADINSNFNIALAYQNLKFKSEEHPAGEDGVIDETHMSTRTKWNKMRPFVGKNEDKQKSSLKIMRGPAFSPQLNIFTTIEGYHALDTATESRLNDGDGPQFNSGDIPQTTVAKNGFLNRLDGFWNNVGGKYNLIKAQLRHTLLVIEPRRNALIAQTETQEQIYEQESLHGVNKPKFDRDSGDASFVKDTGGVWLKTDITNYILKSFKGNAADLKEIGIAIQRANTDFRGDIGGDYDAGNVGWAIRVARLGRRIYLEGEHAAGGMRPVRKKQLDDMIEEDLASWSTLTYSLSSKILGLRHDTMLQEALVTAGHNALLRVNDSLESERGIDSWNMKEKVLVEIRNLGLEGNEDADGLDEKIDAFLEAWNGAMP